MPVTSHLKSLQALEMALRLGSLKAAAEALGITPAATGQRIRALEEYLGMDLLVRGRSGLSPTAALDPALAELRAGFAALDRVTDTLAFQRGREIHLAADPDWAELWLAPRLDGFRADRPGILFCINGAGDVAPREGGPDLRVALVPEDAAGPSEALFTDWLVPVTGPDNLRRLGAWDPEAPLEGLPLLHLEEQRDDPARPGWPAWIAAHGGRREGAARGVHYRRLDQAMEAVRRNVGFLVCGLALARQDLGAGTVALPHPATKGLRAPCAYRMTPHPGAERRPAVRQFLDWLRDEAQETRDWLARQTG